MVWRSRKLFIICLLAGLSVPWLQARGDFVEIGRDGDMTVIQINRPPIGQVKGAAFEVIHNANIKVEGAAAIFGESRQRRGGRPLLARLYYGWILDSKTRKVVWHGIEHFQEVREDRRPSINFIQFDQEISLSAGTYELYYTSVFQAPEASSFGRSVIIKKMNAKGVEFEKDRDDLLIRIKAESRQIRPLKDLKQAIKQAQEGAIVSMIQVGDSGHETQGFTLTRPSMLKIYALGEGLRRDGGIYDFSWIEDADSHETRWSMRVRNTKAAGGAKKNLMVDQMVRLEPGNYLVHYISDSFHSAEGWIGLPPDDPFFWGVTIWPASSTDRDAVCAFRPPKERAPDLALIKVRDSEQRVQAFTLEKDMPLRIRCLGEKTHSQVADYGWIVHADNWRLAWEMAFSKAIPAGGAYKNQLLDEVVFFKAGSYVAYYRTDDSHAFGNWNDDPPTMQDHWGLSIWTKDPADSAHFILDKKPVRTGRDNLIVAILDVGDDAYVEKTFYISRPMEVRVMAIGEGTQHDGMVDYGWIENDVTGRVVWEMKFKDTKHAGGHLKNREFNGVIHLDKGRYKVYFDTDGSHSATKWNADPPFYPDRYGIVILHEGGSPR